MADPIDLTGDISAAINGAAERGDTLVLGYVDDGGRGAKYLSIRGRAHTDPAANDAVYANMIEGERGQDPDRKGVAVIIDVDSVIGAGPNGPFQMARA